MSWETVREDKEPCACGRGFVLTVVRSDDWGRVEHDVNLHCAECERTYMLYSYDYHSSGMIETASRWVLREDFEQVRKLKSESDEADLLAKNQITEYLRLHYLEPWMALFQDVRRNKKAVWSKFRELGITGYSYSLFCKKIDASRLNDHIESYVSSTFSGPVLRILGFNDDMIETLAASSREANDRYNKAKREMLQRGFH